MSASSPFRLGFKPAPQEMLARAPKVPGKFGATQAPEVMDRSNVPYTPFLGHNDVYPDCTAAGLANCAAAQAALNGYTLGGDNDAILAFYAAVKGIPATDTQALVSSDGAYIPDVLTYQQTNGFNIGPQLLVGAWGTLNDPTDFNTLRNIVANCGSADLGVLLSDADMNSSEWVVNYPASAGDPTPKDGHCLVLFSWDGTTDDSAIRLATWGTLQVATWGWLKRAIVEAHLVVWRQLGRAGLQDLEYDALVADAAAFGVGVG